jgi:hypothetical protein
MDDGTASRLLTEGQPVSLIIEGRRVDGVMVAGLQVSSHRPTYIDLLMPTPVGEPDRRRQVPLNRVEMAPLEKADQ